MRMPSQTETFELTIDKQSMQENAMKLTKGIGIIKPEHIESHLFNLKKSSLIRRSPLLQTAIKEYENTQQESSIKLFNTAGINNNANNMTPAVPYLTTKTGTVFMNMNRICNWNIDMNGITNLSELTDLRAVLEYAYVILQITKDKNTEMKLFNNSVFVEKLTKIYMSLFYTVISRCLGASQTSAIDSASSNMKFAICKFFLIYCMEYPDDDSTNALAYTCIKNPNTTYNSILMYNENLGLDYTMFTQFLRTFAMSFFANNLSVHDFITTWMKLYGEPLRLAIESPIILLYFIYATYYNARLGSNNTRLVTRYKEQINGDLTKLVAIIYSVIR